MAKTYYITSQLVYVTTEEREDTTHTVEYSNGGSCISFKAHVYRNALNEGHLVGIKVKDDVWVTIPVTTPSITF